ncbi:MAG: ROK family transcriptional regulator [Alkalispirochaetaceae bacterium]
MQGRISNVNVSRVIRSIFLNPGISRVEISRQLNLNKSTISKIVGDLLELELIQISAVGDASPMGGRKPLHLTINKEWGSIMGVEIQTEAFTVVGINLRGEVFFSHSELIDLKGQTILEAFTTIYSRFRPRLESFGMPLIGVGVGLSGIVNSARGIIYASNPLEIYQPLHFNEAVSRLVALDVPVIIENDANCCCFGELVFQQAERHENFVFVLGELRKHSIKLDDYRIMAIGLGIVLNGEVHYGHDYSAGEFRSILHREANVNQFSITDEEARRFLSDREVDERIITELSDNLAFLVNTLNMSKVVLGGPIEQLKETIVPILERRIQAQWAYPNHVECEISFSRFGEMSVAFGAAAMFLERLISIPEVSGEEETGLRLRGAELLQHLSALTGG